MFANFPMVWLTTCNVSDAHGGGRGDDEVEVAPADTVERMNFTDRGLVAVHHAG